MPKKKTAARKKSPNTCPNCGKQVAFTEITGTEPAAYGRPDFEGEARVYACPDDGLILTDREGKPLPALEEE